jgi:hypothetical protein
VRNLRNFTGFKSPGVDATAPEQIKKLVDDAHEELRLDRSELIYLLGWCQGACDAENRIKQILGEETYQRKCRGERVTISEDARLALEKLAKECGL